jgi:hypothetical protein
MRIGVGLLLLVLSGACGDPEESEELPMETSEGVLVQIGVPGGEHGLDFVGLEPGSELRLQTFGQGGTHVLLGIRSVGIGNRGYVTIQIENLDTGKVVRTPAPVRPQLLVCQSDGMTCDLVPLLASTSGLAPTGPEGSGAPVEISASVRNDAGKQAFTRHAFVLSTADL